MRLEDRYFKTDFHYKVKLVNKWIAIIRYSEDKKRSESYKNLVFRMMKDIVKKNIANYLNLLTNTGVRNIPDRSELVAECYIVFDKCVDKFVINDKYNFYFYFNKSLSRGFYREYQKELRRNNKSVEISDSLESVNKGFQDHRHIESTELLLDCLGFNDLERKICISRISGEKTSEFLKDNPDITSGQYSRCLKKIKSILTESKEKGEI